MLEGSLLRITRYEIKRVDGCEQKSGKRHTTKTWKARKAAEPARTNGTHQRQRDRPKRHLLTSEHEATNCQCSSNPSTNIQQEGSCLTNDCAQEDCLTIKSSNECRNSQVIWNPHTYDQGLTNGTTDIAKQNLMLQSTIIWQWKQACYTMTLSK